MKISKSCVAADWRNETGSKVREILRVNSLVGVYGKPPTTVCSAKAIGKTSLSRNLSVAKLGAIILVLFWAPWSQANEQRSADCATTQARCPYDSGQVVPRAPWPGKDERMPFEVQFFDEKAARQALDQLVQRAEALASTPMDSLTLSSVLRRAESQAVAEVKKGTQNLRARFSRAGRTAEGWIKYLDFDAFECALQKPEELSEQSLQRMFGRLAAGHAGLELRCFAELRESVRRLLLRRQATKTADANQLELTRREMLTRLVAWLREYAQTGSPQALVEAAEAYRWLEELGLADGLAPVPAELAHQPALVAGISERLVHEVLSRPVEDVSPVYDVILGSHLYGTGRTRGQLGAELVPSSKRALLALVIEGSVQTESNGYNGPVRFFSKGNTSFETKSLLQITGRGLTAWHAETAAQTSSHLEWLYAVRGGALVETLAWRRAMSQKPLAEYIAARHAEDRLNRRIDRQLREAVDRANQWFNTQVVVPLRDRGLYPKDFRFWTTDKMIFATGTLPLRPLGPTSAPPKLGPETDCFVCLHESMANIAWFGVLAGRILEEEGLLRQAEAVWGRIPERFQRPPDEEAWTVVLAEKGPLFVSFRDNQIRITFRGRSYRRGDRSYPGMDITVTYLLVSDAEGVVAKRVGELEIYPPGFRPGQRRLSAREQVLRTLIERRLSKVFDAEWRPTVLRLQPTASGNKAVVLRWQELIAQNGWLAVGFKVVDAAE